MLWLLFVVRILRVVLTIIIETVIVYIVVKKIIKIKIILLTHNLNIIVISSRIYC